MEKIMNLYNNKITTRTNKFFREKFINKNQKKALKSHDWSLLCNNCTGGFVSHDLGEQFRSPTVNLFFPNRSFFDFCEHVEYYLSKEVVEFEDNSVNYPVGIIYGENDIADLPIHFMHYKDFISAKSIWDKRKCRFNFDKIYVIWTFAFDNYTEDDYIRFNNLNYKNKVAFTNDVSMAKKYDSVYYLKGFDNSDTLGLISLYCDFLGHRYYDQFDFVKWFNAE